MFLSIGVIFHIATPLFSLFKINFHKTPASCNETAQQSFLTAHNLPLFCPPAPGWAQSQAQTESEGKARRSTKGIITGKRHEDLQPLLSGPML